MISHYSTYENNFNMDMECNTLPDHLNSSCYTVPDETNVPYYHTTLSIIHCTELWITYEIAGTDKTCPANKLVQR